MRPQFLSAAAAAIVKAGRVGMSAEAETVEAAAVGTGETGCTGKDVLYLICDACTRLRIYVTQCCPVRLC